MTKSTLGDLSTAAASNTVIDGQNVDENCQMNTMNNAIRALGAAGKGALSYVSTSGTDTYTATLAPVPDGYATGFQYLVNFLSPNTSATPSINLNAFGAATITLGDGSTSLVAGNLNGCHILEYDGSVMRVLNPRLVDATNGGLSVGGSLALKPSDLLTKSSPTTSDSVVIQDAAASNAAKTATIPKVMAALFSPITNSLSGDVALNNTANYFDGPSVAQGTTGTWFAAGTVTLTGSASDSVFDVKLWDGTSIIASLATVVKANITNSASLSGFLASPVGNIRISVKDSTDTSGHIIFNSSGSSKDSTLTAIRIA